MVALMAKGRVHWPGTLRSLSVVAGPFPLQPSRINRRCVHPTSLLSPLPYRDQLAPSARLLLAPVQANGSPFEQGPAFLGLSPFPNPAAYYHPAAFPYADIDGRVGCRREKCPVIRLI